MTEEIIKECKFYMSFSEDCNEILDDNGNEVYKCSGRQDCYFKQLIRLKQQHNDDTEEIAKLGFDVSILEKERDTYHSALEEIRNIIQNYESKEWNCFNDMDIKLEEISKVINEVIGEK